jgi:allantoinase
MIVWDPEAEWVVDPARLFHRHPVTPYSGMKLSGRAKKTLLRGEVICDDGDVLPVASGRMIGPS